MTMQDLATTVQELRLETRQRGFTKKLAHVVSAIGEIPDHPPAGFAPDTMVRLRELTEETVEAVEQRIESGGDDQEVQQRLAGTVYEIRKRMEDVEMWYRHKGSSRG
jgi:hypothetical protein